jgi:hypothetical protein
MAGILDILNVVSTVVDRVIPDPKDKLELQEKLATIADQEAARAHDENMGQIEVNKVEAANPNMFVAGWRPFIGWVGGRALAYNVMVAPMLHLGVADTAFLETILLAILGMGAMRSYDKAKGTETALPSGTHRGLVNPPPLSSSRQSGRSF